MLARPQTRPARGRAKLPERPFRVRKAWRLQDTWGPDGAVRLGIAELCGADGKDRLPLTWRMQSGLLAQLRKAGRLDLVRDLESAAEEFEFAAKAGQARPEREALRQRLKGRGSPRADRIADLRSLTASAGTR